MCKKDMVNLLKSKGIKANVKMSVETLEKLIVGLTEEVKEEVKTETKETISPATEEKAEEVVKTHRYKKVVYPSISNDGDKKIINIVKYNWNFKERHYSRTYTTAKAPKDNIVTVTNEEVFSHLVQGYILEIQKDELNDKIFSLNKSIGNIEKDKELTDGEKELKISPLKEEKEFLINVKKSIREFSTEYVRTYEEDKKDDIAKVIAFAKMQKAIALCPLYAVDDVKEVFSIHMKKSGELWENGKTELTEEEKKPMANFRKAMLENAGISEKAKFNITHETSCTGSMKLSISNIDGIECIMSLVRPDSNAKKSPIANARGKKEAGIIQNTINYFITQRLYTKICGKEEE